MTCKQILLSFIIATLLFSTTSLALAQKHSECGVVPITVKHEASTAESAGSGWVVGRNLVLTALHVIEPSIEEILDGEPYPVPLVFVEIKGVLQKAEIVKTPKDNSKDLALLSVETSDIPALSLSTYFPRGVDTLT